MSKALPTKRLSFVEASEEVEKRNAQQKETLQIPSSRQPLDTAEQISAWALEAQHSSKPATTASATESASATVASGLKEKAGSTADAIKAQGSEILNAVSEKGAAVAESLNVSTTNAQATVDGIKFQTSEMADVATYAARNAVTEIKDKASELVEAASKKSGEVSGNVQVTAASTKESASKAVETVKEKASELLEAASKKSSEVSGSVQGTATSAKETASRAVENVKERAAETASSVATYKDTAIDNAAAALHRAHELYDGAAEQLIEVAETAYSKASAINHAVADSAHKAYDSTAHGLESATAKTQSTYTTLSDTAQKVYASAAEEAEYITSNVSSAAAATQSKVSDAAAYAIGGLSRGVHPEESSQLSDGWGDFVKSEPTAISFKGPQQPAVAISAMQPIDLESGLTTGTYRDASSAPTVVLASNSVLLENPSFDEDESPRSSPTIASTEELAAIGEKLQAASLKDNSTATPSATTYSDTIAKDFTQIEDSVYAAAQKAAHKVSEVANSIPYDKISETAHSFLDHVVQDFQYAAHKVGEIEGKAEEYAKGVIADYNAETSTGDIEMGGQQQDTQHPVLQKWDSGLGENVPKHTYRTTTTTTTTIVADPSTIPRSVKPLTQAEEQALRNPATFAPNPIFIDEAKKQD